MTITQEAVADLASRHGLTYGEAEHVLRRQQAKEAPAPTPQTGPPKGQVNFPPDQVLAVDALVREGVPLAEAQGAVLRSDLESFRSSIEHEKARIQQRADAEAEVRWLATPEGKTYVARQHREAVEAKKNRANEARDFLAANGFTDTDDLNDDEAIKLSGIDRDDTERLLEDDPAANAAKIAEIDARLYGEAGGEQS